MEALNPYDLVVTSASRLEDLAGASRRADCVLEESDVSLEERAWLARRVPMPVNLPEGLVPPKDCDYAIVSRSGLLLRLSRPVEGHPQRPVRTGFGGGMRDARASVAAEKVRVESSSEEWVTVVEAEQLACWEREARLFRHVVRFLRRV